jgi:predicted chitinase
MFPNSSPALSAPIGPGQSNRPADVLAIKKLLNQIIDHHYLTFLQHLPETSVYDKTLESALRAIQQWYFFEARDPHGVVAPGDTLFQFLTEMAIRAENRTIAQEIMSDLYPMAAKMVPGGVDHISFKTITATGANGKKVHQKQRVVRPGNIHVHLPNILNALRDKGLNDHEMLLVALATIRAETGIFKPIPEGVSKYNSTNLQDPSKYFDKYSTGKLAKNLGNADLADAQAYIGRGFVQLTGKSNYARMGKELKLGESFFLNNPDLADDSLYAAKILAQFLKDAEAQMRAALADRDLKRVRRLVNGGSNGLKEFVESFEIGEKYITDVTIRLVITKIRRSPPKAKPATVSQNSGGSNPFSSSLSNKPWK